MTGGTSRRKAGGSPMSAANASSATSGVRVRHKGSLRDRVLAQLIIDQDTGCLLWTGCRVKGYGFTSDGGKNLYVHRVMYEWFVGPIPTGMELDHLCRVKHCAAPAHLEAVTHVENLRRGAGSAGRHNAVKTECPHGHPYDE